VGIPNLKPTRCMLAGEGEEIFGCAINLKHLHPSLLKEKKEVEKRYAFYGQLVLPLGEKAVY
jgi:hypothetical protein